MKFTRLDSAIAGALYLAAGVFWLAVTAATQKSRTVVSRAKLSRGGSVLLDLLRFGAACTVLLSHFGHPGISVGFPDLTAAGHLAVAVFFVLSGFVIRYATSTREASAREYLIDRTSRIYSVVAPALALTVICELAALGNAPAVLRSSEAAISVV